MLGIREIALRLVGAVDPLLGRLVPLLPTRVRYGKQFTSTLNQLRASRSDISEAAAHQLDALRQTLSSAAETPYWQDALAGADPAAPVSALSALPVLSRDDLASHGAEMLQENAAVERVATSGSSGNFVAFYLPKNRRSFEWAHVIHAWEDAGYTVNDWRVVVRGAPVRGSAVQVVHALREVRVSSTRTDEQTYREVLQQIRSKKIRYLHGYPSALSVFARWLAGAAPEIAARIAGVFPVSEPLDRSQYERFRTSCPHAKILPFYGLSEKSAFGICSDVEQSEYRFVPGYGFVELLNASDQPVEIGQRGRIITTRLGFPGASLLRYDTGDTARLLTRNSNGAAQTVASIQPRRASESATDHDGNEVQLWPGFYERSTLFAGGVKEFQIRQKAPGDIQLLVEPSDDAPQTLADALLHEASERLGSNFVVEVSLVTEIPHSGNGKRPVVVKEFV